MTNEQNSPLRLRLCLTGHVKLLTCLCRSQQNRKHCINFIFIIKSELITNSIFLAFTLPHYGLHLLLSIVFCVLEHPCIGYMPFGVTLAKLVFQNLEKATFNFFN